LVSVHPYPFSRRRFIRFPYSVFRRHFMTMTMAAQAGEPEPVSVAQLLVAASVQLALLRFSGFPTFLGGRSVLTELELKFSHRFTSIRLFGRCFPGGVPCCKSLSAFLPPVFASQWIGKVFRVIELHFCGIVSLLCS